MNQASGDRAGHVLLKRVLNVSHHFALLLNLSRPKPGPRMRIVLSAIAMRCCPEELLPPLTVRCQPHDRLMTASGEMVSYDDATNMSRWRDHQPAWCQTRLRLRHEAD